MTKKLKIQFVKFEKAIAAQLLEVDGFNWVKDDSTHIRLYPSGYLTLWEEYASIPSVRNNNNISSTSFNDNTERDKYLNKVIKWISEEQFATKGKLEIGKECEVSDDGEGWVRRIFAGKTAKQFGEPRTIALGFENSLILRRWKYVRPIDSFVQPKIDGDVYTWEMEVGE